MHVQHYRQTWDLGAALQANRGTTEGPHKLQRVRVALRDDKLHVVKGKGTTPIKVPNRGVRDVRSVLIVLSLKKDKFLVNLKI